MKGKDEDDNEDEDEGRKSPGSIFLLSLPGR